MIRWLAEHVEQGETAYRIGRDGDTLVAEWLGVVRLVAKRDASTFCFDPEDSADPNDVDKIVRGSGQLLLRHLEGKLALHGAAIDIAGAAIVLLGGSGEGKSTLAASACLRSEVRFLADDAVALEDTLGQVHVVVLEENHWLEADARAALGLGDQALALGKAPVRALRRGTSAPLAAFVELRFADVPAPTVKRMSGLEAAAALMPQVVRFVIDEPATQRRELDELVGLLEHVPLLRLERPRALDLLPATTDLLVRIARDRHTFTHPPQKRSTSR